MKHFTPTERSLDPIAASRGLVRWYDDERSVQINEWIAQALDGRGEWLRSSSDHPIEVPSRSSVSPGLLRRFAERASNGEDRVHWIRNPDSWLAAKRKSPSHV